MTETAAVKAGEMVKVEGTRYAIEVCAYNGGLLGELLSKKFDHARGYATYEPLRNQFTGTVDQCVAEANRREAWCKANGR